MDDTDTIERTRAAMARLGQPADDLTDDEIRRRARGLTGRRRDALAQVARVLEEPDPDDCRPPRYDIAGGRGSAAE